ncbi:hypothetical protein FRX31_032499 [Thalictrum thalictroides]|uniref:DUF4283 domain-containing protein n=1 Tax=Thalictrum thalictroides TaxID=46969 RepID=A0A7J6UZ16_THATH|nr:hypothetical protein FRX31_032499 [Thalictrum thalictroides]
MWIQVYGLPLERHTSENVRMIGASFGEVLAVDSVGSADERSPYARVQVMYNIHQPIKKEAMVRLSEGILKKHCVEVDPEAEMKIEDYKYREWEEEKNCQMEKMKLTKSLMEPTNAQSIMEGGMVTNVEDIANNKGDKMEEEEENMGVNGGINSILKDVESSKECSSGFRSMKVSPLQVMEAQINITSVTMADKSGSVISNPIDEPLALENNHPQYKSCKRALFLSDSPTSLPFQFNSSKPIVNPNPCPNSSLPLSSHQFDEPSEIPNLLPNLNLSQTLETTNNHVQSVSSSNPIKPPPEPILKKLNFRNHQSNPSFKKRKIELIKVLSQEGTEIKEGDTVKEGKRKKEKAFTSEEEEDRKGKKRKMSVVFTCDAVRGSIDMLERDRHFVTQERIDKLVELMKLFKHERITKKQEEVVKKELEWLRKRKFSMGRALVINGVPSIEETDDSYAIYMLSYGIPIDEDEDKEKDGGISGKEKTEGIDYICRPQNEQKEVQTSGNENSSSSSVSLNTRYVRKFKKDEGFAAAVPEQQPRQI